MKNKKINVNNYRGELLLSALFIFIIGVGLLFPVKSSGNKANLVTTKTTISTTSIISSSTTSPTTTTSILTTTTIKPIRNVTVETPNWAGITVMQFINYTTFLHRNTTYSNRSVYNVTSVSAKWKVQNVTNNSMAQWIGLEDNHTNILQAGTQSNEDGTATIWWEYFPENSYTSVLVAHIGDNISGVIKETSLGNFTIIINDTTSNVVFIKNITDLHTIDWASSPTNLSSYYTPIYADYVVEHPSIFNQLIKMGSFNSTNFTNVSATINNKQENLYNLSKDVWRCSPCISNNSGSQELVPVITSSQSFRISRMNIITK
ncbi:MAG: hypothetical protein KGI06_03845 [Candidatus Micrarchaeota archaeon]|nr:hypothetical protein [Candidatus Micrarchaeota archaeon]